MKCDSQLDEETRKLLEYAHTVTRHAHKITDGDPDVRVMMDAPTTSHHIAVAALITSLVVVLSPGASADWVHGTEPHGSSTDHHAETLADLLARGDAHFKRSDYAHAAQTFGEAAARYPQHPIAHFAHGHSLFALGHYHEAATSIRHGLARHPDWGRVRMNRRAFYTDPAEFDAQLARLEEWVTTHPDDPDALFLLGYHYYFTQEPHKARQAFEHVLRLDPHDGEARYFLGLLVVAQEV